MGVDPDESYETYNKSNCNHTIHIKLLKPKTIICPICGSVDNSKLVSSKSQFIKYSSALENNITIKLYRRVYRCSCGHYFKQDNPFAEEKRSTSIQKDLNILRQLKLINQTFSSVAKNNNVSVTYVTDVFDKKVDIRRLTLPHILCVDEVYAKRLSYHKYCFIAYDPRNRKIIDVLDSRHIDDTLNYFYAIPYEERKNVKFFSTDLYEPYRVLAQKCFPEAIICDDSFHVIKNISSFFHRIRIKVMKKYAHLKDNNDNYYWLFKSFFKLLTKDRSKLSYHKFNVKRSGQYMSTMEIVDYMLSIDNELKLAYELLHEYRAFNEIATSLNAREWLDELIERFKCSGIEEYKPAWKLLVNWHDEIINSFTLDDGYRISNGPMERVNRDIKTIFRNAYGSTNFIRMRNRIMYVLNDDSPILYNRKRNTNKLVGKPRGIYRKHK